MSKKTTKKQAPKRDKAQDKMQKVSEKIQVILLKNNMALKPMMSFSPEGIIPQVRLVDTAEANTKENVIDKADKGKAGGDEDQDGTSESK